MGFVRRGDEQARLAAEERGDLQHVGDLGGGCDFGLPRARPSRSGTPIHALHLREHGERFVHAESGEGLPARAVRLCGTTP